MAGLNVGGVSALAGKYLDSVAVHGGVEYSYQPGMGSSPSMTAVGLLGRQYLGAEHDSPMLAGGRKYLMDHLPDENLRNVYYWYYGTQAMHNMRGPDWDTWNRKMRELLIRTQSTRGHEGGSWYFPGGKGDVGGRLYNTSMAIMTLEVYYRYVPLYTAEANQEF